MSKGVIMALVVLLVSVSSMYQGRTAVTLLTSKTFDKVYKGIWLVEFYAPWCGHCKNLAPEYEKAAEALKDIANIAAIDASNEKVNVQIQGYPTIKLFVNGKITDYNGDRNANGIVDFMLRQYKKIANSRLGGGSSHSDSAGSSNDEKDVIVLTDSNFQELVYSDEGAWFVEFYAPWCGHCKNLAPEWAALASNLKGEVKVAKIDATQNKASAERFGVSGYPTIKFFPEGKKDDSQVIDYNQGRSESAMAQWARQQTKGSSFFQHTRLASQAVYDENCKGRYICIISFLPHIMDSSKEEREQYLELIKTTALKYRGKPFKFLWAQGGDHFEWEQKIGVSGTGYPGALAIFEVKKVWSKLKRSFSEASLDEYLTDILANKAKFSKLYEMPKLKTINIQQEVQEDVDSQEKAKGQEAQELFKDDTKCGSEDKCKQPNSQL